MENFFSHFKTECFHLHSFHSAKQVKHAAQQYIRFYNHARFQTKLNNLSPYEYRTQAALFSFAPFSVQRNKLYTEKRKY
ncbi:IS3 family transposase [Paenibacillus sanfengchensis]|uniref:IS3 family transposase n=1 Tax=Paenibacillus TaxID=44249 RepID=UPI003A5BAC69